MGPSPEGCYQQLGVHALAAVTAVVNDEAEAAVKPESRGDVLRHEPAPGNVLLPGARFVHLACECMRVIVHMLAWFEACG